MKAAARAELRRHLFAARGIDVRDDDLGAFLHEELDRGLADAARAARDDRDLSGQFLAHSVSSALSTPLILSTPYRVVRCSIRPEFGS